MLHGAAFSLLLLLSGCSCMKKGDQATTGAANEQDEVLVSISGKPALTLKEFKAFVNEAISADPQMQMMAQLMPDFEEQVFDRAKVRELVISEWAKRTNAAAKEEYKKQREQAEKALAMMLNQQAFLRDHVTQVSDADAQKYYDENKDKDQSLMQSPEGISAKGKSFKTLADAQAFLTKVETMAGDIAKAGAEDLGVVHKNSFLDKTVKAKVLQAQKFPAILPIIKAGDKEFWVVKVFGRETAKYRPFDQAKEGIKELLKNRQTEQTVEKKLAEYQKEYNIVVNKGYFERKKKEAAEKQAAAAKEKEAPKAEPKKA